jgi:hypothetical protein
MDEIKGPDPRPRAWRGHSSHLWKFARGAGFRPLAAFGALAFAVFGFPSQAAPQPPRFELRAGVTASTALAEDAVANSELQQLLGTGFQGAVTATPSVGPTIAASVILPLRTRTLLDVSLGWTFSRLNAEDANGQRELHDLGIAQISIAVRYQLRPRIDAGCGFGAARYSGNDTGLFATGSEFAPLLECGSGFSVRAGAQTFVLRAFGQAQRFRTPALRDAGAQTGSVFRFGAQAGIAFGGRP